MQTNGSHAFQWVTDYCIIKTCLSIVALEYYISESAIQMWPCMHLITDSLWTRCHHPPTHSRKQALKREASTCLLLWVSVRELILFKQRHMTRTKLTTRHLDGSWLKQIHMNRQHALIRYTTLACSWSLERHIRHHGSVKLTKPRQQAHLQSRTHLTIWT